MLLLTSITTIVRINIGSAGDIEVTRSWVDNLSGVFTPGGGPMASATGTGPVTIVAAPAASTQRNVRAISITNNHASAQPLIEVECFDGTNAAQLMQATLLPGETLTFDQVGDWSHQDANGGLYPALGSYATQSDMEAATSTAMIVSPGMFIYHPLAAKFFVKAGVSGNILASYNVIAVSDGGTGRMTATMVAPFSSANWCCGSECEQVSTTLTAAGGNVERSYIRNAGQAAGSIQIDTSDFTAPTYALRDPVTFHVWGYGDQ